jgi:glucokinase
VNADGPAPALVGIDIGGTKTDIVVSPIASAADAVHRRIATAATDGAGAVLQRAFETAASAAHDAGLVPAFVGVCVPGTVEDDVVRLATNVPGLDGVNVRDVAADLLPGAQVDVVNDLNAAALALVESGSLRAVATGLVIGLGTGVAAGLVIDGRLRPGGRGTAGEIGFARVPLPGTGGEQWGAIETVASGLAFDRLAAEYGCADSTALFRAAAHDAALAAELDLRLDLLVGVLATCCLLIDPDVVALYGGLAADPWVRRRVGAGLAGHLDPTVPVRWEPPGHNPSLQGAMLRAARLVALSHGAE